MSTESVLFEIAAEREHQITTKGWTYEHDDEHIDSSLSQVAACYALHETKRIYTSRKFPRDVGRSVGENIIIHDIERVPVLWPNSWHGSTWGTKDRRRELVIAAALLVAEIERLDRKEGKAP